MPGSLRWEDYEDDPEFEAFERKSRRKAKPRRAPVEAEPVEVEEAFTPSFTGSKHEKKWIQEHLGQFYDDHLITDVLRQVRGGKEATVYCCRAHPSTGERLLAAKVYRPPEFRTMRNDAVYREGRFARNEAGKEVRDHRARAAIEKRTKVGRTILHASWLVREYEVLTRLHEVGADAPKPWGREENAILMTYVGDEDAPAPTLSQVSLERGEARPLFERVMQNVEAMLSCGFVHGDLSAYNVLYHAGQIAVIDFPQAVDPFNNSSARSLFQRDVERVCAYFAKYQIDVDAGRLAFQLWEEAGLPR